MTDKEILADLKKSYDNLIDIIDNNEIYDSSFDESIHSLNKMTSKLANIYSDVYKGIDKEELIYSKNQDGKIYISDDISAEYMQLTGKDSANYFSNLSDTDFDKWEYNEDFIMNIKDMEEEL